MSGGHQGSILDQLLFLIFINDLPDDIICNPNLFADDVSLNTVMYDKNTCTKNLRDVLYRFYAWSVKWKMVFNPDTNKPVESIVLTNRSHCRIGQFPHQENPSLEQRRRLGKTVSFAEGKSQHHDTICYAFWKPFVIWTGSVCFNYKSKPTRASRHYAYFSKRMCTRPGDILQQSGELQMVQ